MLADSASGLRITGGNLSFRVRPRRPTRCLNPRKGVEEYSPECSAAELGGSIANYLPVRTPQGWRNLNPWRANRMASFTNLVYHIVFSTKNRYPWLGQAMRSRVDEYLGGAIRGERGIALIVNGTADHIHILARLRQDRSLSDLVRAIKANSCGWIHKTYPPLIKFNWQDGYGAFTVSASQIETVREYIANQEKHHRKKTFQEEFVGFLKAHEIPFDDRYLWK
jgi:putative transposase